jgi:hypothetical protein
MHLSAIRKTSLAFMAATAATTTMHGSQPLRVLAWIPPPSTPDTTITTNRRAFFQAAAGALVMTGSSVPAENAVAVEVPTTQDITKGRTTFTKRSLSLSSSGDEDKDEMARKIFMQEKQARILAEKEAQRVADETKQRLAVGRIGIIGAF